MPPQAMPGVPGGPPGFGGSSGDQTDVNEARAPGPPSRRHQSGAVPAGAEEAGLAQPQQEFQNSAASRLERRRQSNRESQARYRQRQLDEIQKTTEVISACQLSTAEAKSKRLVLLKQNRELHSRYLQAVKVSLSLVRDEHPSSAPPGDSSRGSAEAASARISGSTGRPENQDDQPEAPQPDGGKAAHTEAGAMRLGVTRDSRPVVPAKSSSQGVTPPIVRAPLRVEDIMYDPEEDFGVFAESQLAVDAGHPDGSLVAPGGEGLDAGTQERLRLSRRVAASLRNRKRVEAAAAHVRPADVHWVLQSPYAVEGEEPLSFTSAMEGPECMASLYACHFVGLLEEGMLAAVLDQYEAAPADAEASAARNRRKDHVERVALVEHMASAKGMVAGLETALAGTQDAETSPLHLTCGVGGSTLVATSIPNIVHSICARFRRILPQSEWLRMCDAYVGFMIGLTEETSLTQSSCPHRHFLADGRDGHVVSLCPRCCVFACIFVALRDEIAAAAAVDSWPVEAVQVASMRVRAKEVFTFCTLLVSQCMTDLPVPFRQMMCTVRCVKNQGLEAEQEIVLSLFRRMRLTRRAQRAAAGMWRAWRDSRAALDEKFSDALMPLTAVMGLPDMILSSQPHAYGHAVRSVNGIINHVQPSAIDNQADGGDVCICDTCAANIGERLLGATGHSTACAHRAMTRLDAAQKHEAKEFVQLLRTICTPDVVFTTDQYARQTVLALQLGALMDWVWLCKTASEELAREELFDSVRCCLGTV